MADFFQHFQFNVVCVLIRIDNPQHPAYAANVIPIGKVKHRVFRIVGMQSIRLILLHKAVAIDDEDADFTRLDGFDNFAWLRLLFQLHTVFQ